MRQYFVSNPAVAVGFIIVVTIGIVALVVKKFQKMGLEKIRAKVYKSFVEAENRFNHGDNTQKFEYVVNLAKSYLPMPFSMFVTEELLRKVIQMWFNLVKDLLDDGRINGTEKEE